MQKFKQHIKEVIKKQYPELNLVFTQVPSVEAGHIAIPCFDFAKSLRRSPNMIANELSGPIQVIDFIDKVEVVGGYINCFIKLDYLSKQILVDILAKQERYGSTLSGEGKKVLIEHTSINPNASPHVGRARNAMIGDVISRLLRFEGYEVDVHYFVNDIGKQIAMLLLGTEDMDQVNFKDLLEVYVSINNQLKADPGLEKKVFSLLKSLEEGDEQVRRRFRELVDICIKGQTKLLNKLGIEYNVFDYESDYLFNNRLDDIISKLKDLDQLIEDEQGRYVINQEGYNLPMKSPYLVLTRQDKTSLYPLRDIAYTIDKMEQEVDRHIIVLGEDQKLYHQQITAALDILGYEAPEAVHYAFVLLAEGKMATRKGTVILLEEFMAVALDKAKVEMTSRGVYFDDKKARAIAYSSVRYAMLKTSNDKNVTFDWDTALNFEGDSGPYLQYSLARINAILKKCSFIEAIDDEALALKEPEAIALLLEIGRMEDVISQTVNSLSPHLVANYVYGVTKLFSRFYHKHSILKTEDAQLKGARLYLIKATKVVIENCFDILGLVVVESM